MKIYLKYLNPFIFDNPLVNFIISIYIDNRVTKHPVEFKLDLNNTISL